MRAILAFINPANGDRLIIDDKPVQLSDDLIQKIESAVGDKHGFDRVSVSFNLDEKELEREFANVVFEIFNVFLPLASICLSTTRGMKLEAKAIKITKET